MNRPPRDLWPSGQHVATPGANGTVRSGGQQTRLRFSAAGTVPVASATWAQTSPRSQQIVPEPSVHALRPVGQHFAVPP